jgi:hypothetical protein
MHPIRLARLADKMPYLPQVCQAMNLKFPAMMDYNACKTEKQVFLAFDTFETLHHDIQCVPDDNETIRLFNFCTTSPNTVCVMSPWDGLWVFHGQQQKHLFFPTITPKIAEQDCFMLKQQANFMFSTNIPETCEVLDIYLKKEVKSRKKRKALTMVPKRDHTQAWDILGSMEEAEVTKESLMAPSLPEDQYDEDIMKAYSRSIAKMASRALEDKQGSPASKKKTFMYFDEHVLKAMEKHGWRRSDGYTVFIPLACGLCEHWKRLV